jgi:uncharacterized protein DUF3738
MLAYRTSDRPKADTRASDCLAMRLMMQSLLADRFKLALHHETRQSPALALVFDGILSHSITRQAYRQVLKEYHYDFLYKFYKFVYIFVRM